MWLLKKQKNKNKLRSFQRVNSDIHLNHDVSIPILNWFYHDMYYSIYKACSPLIFGDYTDTIVRILENAKLLVEIEEKEKRENFYHEQFITQTYNLYEGQEHAFQYILCAFASLQENTEVKHLTNPEMLKEIATQSGLSGMQIVLETQLANEKIIKKARQYFPDNEMFIDPWLEQMQDIKQAYSSVPDDIQTEEDVNRFKELERGILDNLMKKKEYINVNPSNIELPLFQKKYQQDILSIAKVLGYSKKKDLTGVSFFEFWTEYEEYKQQKEQQTPKITNG